MATRSWSREGEGEGEGKGEGKGEGEGEEDKKKKNSHENGEWDGSCARLSISPFHNHKTKLYNAKDFSCSLFVL